VITEFGFLLTRSRIKPVNKLVVDFTEPFMKSTEMWENKCE